MADLFTWRDAVMSEHGPAASTTRHVLLTLGTHMDAQGGSCFPSTRTLATETALSRKTVEKHLRLAEDGGWIERKPRSGSGQGWRRMEYSATVPEKVGNDVTHVSPEGGESGSPRSGKGGESDALKVGNVVPLSTSKSTPNNNDVRSVFDHWRETSGHTRARYTEGRQRTIRARLKSFTTDDLKQAITTACDDPWYQGQNDRNKRYDWIRTLLKNDEAVEKHLANGGKKNEPEAGHGYRVSREELWAEVEGSE